MVIVLYTLIPMGISIIGGLVASIYVPKQKFISALQHFVAGVVIAAVSIELLPKILGHKSTWTVEAGFVIGVVFMLLMQKLSLVATKKEAKEKLPLGLIASSAIDLLVDGILISISFLAGKASGILITISLSFCAFFLNLTVSSILTQKKCRKATQLVAICAIAFMLPIGAFIGSRILSQFPSSILVGTIAFGVAALLYLGIEELLSEAHKQRDTTMTSASFFLGFLAILLFWKGL